MLANRPDYEPEAIDAAVGELRRRGMPEAVFTHLEAEATAKAAVNRERAEVPLEWPLRIIIALVILHAPILARSFKKDGYDRKAREVYEYLFYGIGCWAGIALLLHLLRYVLAKYGIYIGGEVLHANPTP